MGDALGLLIVYLFFGLIGFLICVYITRAVFMIPTIVDYQRKQYMMLRQIAGKLGVEQDRINEIDDPVLFHKRQKYLKKQAEKLKQG